MTPTFSDLKKNLRRDHSGLATKRLALLGDSATQYLSTAIRGYGFERGFAIELYEAEYDQIEREIRDLHSGLYASHPDATIIYYSVEKLLERFNRVDAAQKPSFAEVIVAEISELWRLLGHHSRTLALHVNFAELNDGVFGHYAAKEPSAFLYQLRTINFRLQELARESTHVLTIDLAALASQVGYSHIHDPRLYAAAKVTLTLDILPQVAKAVIDVLAAASGQLKKCLILDLDNTVWGGVIGDDGIEQIQIGELGTGRAFDTLQRWALELRRRGVILAVCSKNDSLVAQRPFLEHPDMTLRLDDIAVFVANWDNKADNIRTIQATLNIGFDSMVFVDDNPFERQLVRDHLPAVTVPELPADPSDYVPYLRSLNLFETASHSAEDGERTRQYQQESARLALQHSFVDLDAYLADLGMVASVTGFDTFNIPRVAQLTQRSNQFNLRTRRYTEADIARLAKSAQHACLALTLADRFGDHGLIAVVILDITAPAEAFIDTWIMSCRVLKRGMEEFTVNEVVRRARSLGITRIVGEYIPTAKNEMVRDLFDRMGFVSDGALWVLSTGSDVYRKTPIVSQEPTAAQ